MGKKRENELKETEERGKGNEGARWENVYISKCLDNCFHLSAF